MQQETLSVCMIVKNEENNIEKCLKSIQNIADEIIIVDTGSSDNTVDICEKYNAKVIHHQWNNDFSEARNKSLEHASMGWVLFLDADEEIPYEESLEIKKAVNNAGDIKGFYLRLVNIIDNVDIGDAIVFRLFKNDPEHRFSGKMHEQIIHSVQTKYGVNSVISTSIRILHYGYDPSLANIEKKADRNISLLLSYDDKDKTGYYYYSLGNEYTRLGKEQDAMNCFLTAIDKTNLANDMPIYYPYLMTSILKLCFANKKYKQALDYIQKFKKQCKDFKDIYFFECLANIECSKLFEAKNALESYINCKQLNYAYPTGTFDKQYNVNLLMDELSNGIVKHDEKLLSAVIFAKENHQSLVASVKSLNEIAYEVIVITNNNSNLDRQILKNYGARVLDVPFEDDNQVFAYAFKKCRGKFIIILDPLELCSFDAQKLIVELLSTSNKDGYCLYLFDVNTNVSWKSLRILRNNKKLFDFNGFDKFIQKNKIQDTSIFLHKYF